MKFSPLKACPVCAGPVYKDKEREDYFCCPLKVTLPNNQEYNHYSFDGELDTIRIFYLPYKLIIYSYMTVIYHQVKSPNPKSLIQFRKIMKVPTVKIPDEGSSLINKLRLWNLIS